MHVTSDLLKGLSLKGLSFAILPTPQAVSGPGQSYVRKPSERRTNLMLSIEQTSSLPQNGQACSIGKAFAMQSECQGVNVPSIMTDAL